MRYKVYFVVSTDFHVPNFRREFDHTEHTVYQFVEAEDSTPIRDIIKAADSQFNINTDPQITTETRRFHSIYDADFQAIANSKRARESIAKVQRVASPQPAPRQSFFGSQQAIPPDSDVACVECSSKAIGYFRCKDGVTKALCRLHSALEAYK